jgi:uncharacterized protein YbjT (DUF2867 family)
MTTSLNVLVYGATGSQAGPVVHELIQRGHHPRVLTRNAAKAAPLAAIGAEIVEGEMDDLQRLTEVSAGMDAVALLVPFFVPDPARALSYGRTAINAARAAGVKLIVWNSSGLIPPEPTGNPAIDLRIAIADHLRTSGVPHIILQPTVYAENLLGPWTAPFVVQEDRVAYPTPPAMRLGWIASADVGALVVAALERPALAGQSFVISGVEAPDGAELAAAFSDALGRTIVFHALAPREFGGILDQVFGPGAGAKAAEEYEKLWASDQWPPMATDMAPVLELLPVEMHTLREWVAEHASAFTPAHIQHT